MLYIFSRSVRVGSGVANSQGSNYRARQRSLTGGGPGCLWAAGTETVDAAAAPLQRPARLPARLINGAHVRNTREMTKKRLKVVSGPAF